MTTPETRPADRPLTDLLSDLSRETSTLFRKEIELARAETSEKINQAVVALGGIVGGAILALTALIVLAQALVIAIAEMGVPPALSALIVGVIVAAIAYGLIRKGTNDLKAGNLAPSRTTRSLQRDAEIAKEQVQ